MMQQPHNKLLHANRAHLVCSQRALVTPAAIAAAAAAGAARRKQQSPRQIQELSMLLLVNKNFEIQLGRALLERSHLINACQVVDKADYALLIISSQNSRSSNSMTNQEGCTWPVLYANRAAAAAFTSSSSSSTAGALQDGQQLQHMHLPQAAASLLQQQQVQKHLQLQQPPATSTGSSKATCSRCGVLHDVNWQHVAAAQQQDNTLTIQQLFWSHVYAPNDAYVGLAVMFDAWKHSDGCIGTPGWPYVDPSLLPSPQQLQKAADAVRVHADAVRQLKQGQGLGNKDPSVIEAVAELQQLKQELAHLEGLHQAFCTQREGTLQQLLQLFEQHNEQQQQQMGMSAHVPRL